MSGVVTLSVEVELGWGVHDIGDFSHLSDSGNRERAYLRRLLDRCEQLDIPISFDVVGHLLQSACDGDHDGPHADGWFEADPGTDRAIHPLFYAPDVVADIRDCTTSHELCTHTYSHVPCDSVSAETLSWELGAAQEQLTAVTGSRTVSIVPPRHRRPSADLLRDADIEIMRMSRDTSDRSRPARLKELLVGPHPTFEPLLVDGIVETYCTSYPSLTSSALPAGQRSPLAPFSALPASVRQRLQRRYLRQAVRDAADTDGYCHLWCHLYELANEYQWSVVEAFLGDLAAMRNRGEIEVLTMARLNDRVRTTRREVPVLA